MNITATEFKTNLDKYLSMVEQEDILITKNGKTIAKLVNANTSITESLIGIIQNNDTVLDVSKNERITKYDYSN